MQLFYVKKLLQVNKVLSNLKKHKTISNPNPNIIYSLYLAGGIEFRIHFLSWTQNNPITENADL